MAHIHEWVAVAASLAVDKEPVVVAAGARWGAELKCPALGVIEFDVKACEEKNWGTEAAGVGQAPKSMNPAVLQMPRNMKH